MNDFLLKLRILFPAHLAMTVGLVPIFGVFRFFTLVPLNQNFSFQFMEGALEFVIPLVLIGLVYLFLYRHRILWIYFAKNSDRAQDVLTLISFLTGLAMLLLTGNYVEKRFGKLTALDYPSHLVLTPKTNYYKIDNYEIPPNWGAMSWNWHTSGKYNSTLHFELFFASPFLNTTWEMIPDVPLVWYGVRFNESMSNWASDAEKEKQFEKFKRESLKKMESWDFKEAKYFRRLLKSEDFFIYNQAISRLLNFNSENNFIILEAEKEPFEIRIGMTGYWIFFAWCIGTFLFMVVLFFGKSRQGFLKNFRLASRRHRSWLDDILDRFSYRKNQPVTVTFLWILLTVGFLMACSGVIGGFLDHPFLGDWGGLRRIEVGRGEWLRLITFGFLSTGPFIGIINMFILGYFGGAFEKEIGSLGFLLLSIFSLIFGALVSLYFHPVYWVGGASPLAIGLIVAFCLNGIKTQTLSITELKPWIISGYVILVLILGFFHKVDHAANFGGLIGGMMGYFLFNTRFRSKDNYH
ncbi:rhomboid family intramembrane serine protease [Algoriphagus lacus]|uniref:Rhomboid family intramembrane serine protease n=1 Tax=Algoriphagus lacus TaxID=2056311 RepID=A0A418PVV2_9BACT|nr:rhomboid family intramembrane serine protease [Algoriphagus lacus]RIW18182.1 rhomboid family intramembrane serine protease [Algoriphagus lacus]